MTPKSTENNPDVNYQQNTSYSKSRPLREIQAEVKARKRNMKIAGVLAVVLVGVIIYIKKK